MLVAALVISLAANLALAGALLLFLRIGRSRERSFERKEQGRDQKERDLLDRIFYLSEKPWSPPPIDLINEPEPPREPISWPEAEVYEGLS